MGANIKYKDSVFSALFSEPDALRELYSAIEGVSLDPAIPIHINTLAGKTFAPPELELTVKVYNINHGHNEEIARRSGKLEGFPRAKFPTYSSCH
jgi:hypothetical protein